MQHDEEAIFRAARRIDSSEARAAYVREACGDNVSLENRVVILLRAWDEGKSFLESPPAGVDGTVDYVPIAEHAGTVIGPYKLLQQIGEGGMGVVFMAEQREPIQRTVALKIIKPGMDTRQVIARFEAERQALALMDHPNIARVLDAGATDTGRPYFVMDLVKGLPITEYCDQQKLSIRARLEFIAPVCHAVQHAHQKGVIHRDLKPSNVLVAEYDGQPVPKIIDFGVAKATAQRLTERTMFTQFGQIVGTFEYMSPEQARFNQLDVDTRSDIYSLGVVLYELLAGSTPLEKARLRTAAFDEILRIISEEEPPRPSTRLSSSDASPSIAANRHTEPARLSRDLRGELDWIVMKCLEKDRNRRYETANSLAQDVERYLADEPVTARPATRMYKLKKFVRRNKLPVLASAAFVLALVAGVAGTTIGLIRESRQRAIADEQRAEAQRQEREAEDQAAIATAITDFQSEMLSSADPDRMLGDKVTVFQAMMAAVKQLDAGKLAEQPRVEVAVRNVIGTTLHSLGRHEEAQPNLERAVALARQAVPVNEFDLAGSLNNLSVALDEQGKYREAEPLCREALDIARKTLPAGDPHIAAALNSLAIVLESQDKRAQAEPLFRESLDIARQAFAADDPQLISAMINLASLLGLEGKFSEAEPLANEALKKSRQVLPPGHPHTARSLNVLAVVLQYQQKDAEAEPLFRETLDIMRQSLPTGHETIGIAMLNLGNVLSAQRKFADAEPLLRDALKVVRESVPPGHPQIAKNLNSLGLLLQNQGKLAEAEPLLREALEACRAALPADHRYIATGLNNLANLLKEQEKFIEAEPLLRESLAISQRTLPEGHSNIAETRGTLLTVLERQGKFADMVPLYREAITDLEKKRGADHRIVGDVHLYLGRLLTDLQRRSEAEVELLEADRVYTVAADETPTSREECHTALVTLYTDWDKAEPGKGYDVKASSWKAKVDEAKPAGTKSKVAPPNEAPKTTPPTGR